MTTVRVRIEGAQPTDEVTAIGTSLPSAVGRAAYKILGRPGRSISHERIDTHEHRWVWGRGSERYVLLVRESRSGPSGESTRAKVLLSLSGETLVRLDKYAGTHGLSRSAAVERLVASVTP